MVVTSLVEILSIGAILPFLGAMVSPERIFENSNMQPLIEFLGLNEPRQLLLPLTLLFIFTAVVSSGLRLTLLWMQTRLGHGIGADLSFQIYERTLYQPYSVHLSRNSSDVIAGISTKIGSMVNGTILPLLIIASALLILSAILITLIAIDLAVALITFGSFSAIYAFVMILSRKRLAENSQTISCETTNVIKVLQEGVGGIRDVLIDGTQDVYCRIYKSADFILRKAQANNQIIGGAPRFLIEAFGTALIALLAYVLTNRDGGVALAIPLLGVLAMGAQRLLPVLQQLYTGWSSIQGARALVNDVLDLIEQPLPEYARKNDVKKIAFEKSVKLKNLSFRYSNQADWVFQDVNFEIPKGARVGFVGSTGSGKSTLLDLVMALLTPQNGHLAVDDVVINQENFRSWQSRIAHVPQSIFLADTTIAENIAFGIPKEQINYQLVEEVAQQAQIAQTIECMSEGYGTQVGERGIRLSGGQRQRIGLARAFYKKADFIIFDEATSALDNETELDVMESINSMGLDITVLIIAHRLSTLRSCDAVYKIDSGKINSQKDFLPHAF